jgi:hypothetical protein
MHKRMCLIIIISFFITLAFSKVIYSENQQNDCLKCHQGIESINEKMSFLDCEDCHKSNMDSSAKETDSDEIYKNPGDLTIVENTCGKCHGEIVRKVKKSLHATMAGMISGARYLWAAQNEKNAMYSIRQVKDGDDNTPGEFGAIKELHPVPHYKDSNQPVDDYLRNQCLRCHLWTEGARRPGDYRSSGCSACHVLYADDGLSRSGDPKIPGDKPGHPVRHEITTKIPAQQCVHCHNRGGRAGVSFLGMMESDGYGTPFRADGTKQPKLHGKNYNYLRKELHFEAGMQCIDCHTLNDIHGDGNIYSKRKQAVEIECADCHGDTGKYSILETSRGNSMENIYKQDGEILLKNKFDGKVHNIPQIRKFAENKSLPVSMSIKGHMDRLECYACHARWTPQCYGCHTKMDMGKKGYDWVDDSENGTYQWEESRSYLRWETPLLGINPKGKVSTFITGCQAIFTQIGEDGKALELNKVFVTYDGHYGIANNPVQPHTNSKKARTCENCHGESKAMGLGSGHYISKLNGLDIPFELERIVDEDGNQIQGTSHVGARPFNKEELQRIKRIDVCLGCHKETSPVFWESVKEKWGVAKNNKTHQDILNRIFKKANDK